MNKKLWLEKELSLKEDVKKELNKSYFPLFKVVFENGYRFRDIDAGYLVDSEPIDLLRKSYIANLYVRDEVGEDWKLLYDGLSPNMIEAHLELEEVKAYYSTWKQNYVTNKPVMFIYQNNVFKAQYVFFDQFAVIGTPIEPDKYYTDEGSIKVDFFKSYVTPINKNTILIFNEQVYYQGELLFSREELLEAGVETYITNNILEFIKKERTFPEDTMFYEKWGSGRLYWPKSNKDTIV